MINSAVDDSKKKTTVLQIRINDDIYQLFKETCEENGSDVSKAIRTYINESVKQGELFADKAVSDLSLQNVITNCSQTIVKQSRGYSWGGALNLHNKEEREQWLRNFRSWGVWLEVPQVNKTFYRYNFKNGCAVIIEVGVEYWDAYSTERGKSHERITYSIIDNEHKKFNSQGDSFTCVIQWLTKYAKEIL